MKKKYWVHQMVDGTFSVLRYQRVTSARTWEMCNTKYKEQTELIAEALNATDRMECRNKSASTLNAS